MNSETKSKPCPYCTGDPVDFADDAGYEMTIFWKGVGEPVIRVNEYPYSVPLSVLWWPCRDSGQQPIRPRDLLRGLPVLRRAV